MKELNDSEKIALAIIIGFVILSLALVLMNMTPDIVYTLPVNST